jgi:hypothetical protein
LQIFMEPPRPSPSVGARHRAPPRPWIALGGSHPRRSIVGRGDGNRIAPRGSQRLQIFDEIRFLSVTEAKLEQRVVVIDDRGRRTQPGSATPSQRSIYFLQRRVCALTWINCVVPALPARVRVR